MQEKELRLALVCYGGISLAVYMHGITREAWKLLRASRALTAGEPRPADDTEAVYYDLLARVGKHIRLRVMADIIAGASAGGINGIFLAEAISSGRSLDPLVDLWLEKADIDELLDEEARLGSKLTKLMSGPLMMYLRRRRSADFIGEIEEPDTRREVEEKLARFIRSRWFSPPFSGSTFSGFLLDALEAIHNSPDGPPLLPNGQPLDLFVTVTDFAGHPEKLRLHSPKRIVETEHRKIIAFRDSGHNGANRHLAALPSLAFAARATASFPGAFPPFRTLEMDEVVSARGGSWGDRDAFLRKVFPHRAEKRVRETASLLDGSILNNAPFRPAIAALKNRPATREVDRRFVYIDPKPGIRSIGGRSGNDDAVSEEPPGFFTTILKSLSDIPREQPIRDDLDALQGMSRRVRRMQHVLAGIARSTDAEINEALGLRTFTLKPSVARLSALRDKANAAAVARAGYAYPGYAHLKLSQIVETMAVTMVDLGGHGDPGPGEDVRRALWAWVHHNNIDEITRTVKPKLAAADKYVGFLRSYDLGYRTRRVRYAMRQLGTLIDTLTGEDRDVAEGAKAVLYEMLAPFLDRRNRSFFGDNVRSAATDILKDTGAAVRAYGNALALVDCDQRADERFSKMLRQADLPPAVRRVISRAWLGFSFYDIATFPLLQGEGLDEYDEIKVDRISPDDATSLRAGGAETTLKGIRFNSFGAFFSRAYRENDYLWGRLHGAERLVDIVLSTLPTEHQLYDDEIYVMKRNAFRAILNAEEGRLTRVPELIAELRAEVG
ncbi:patatin-like protein [Pacificimonas sp. WHA3]|uniref:Patatin-like protein n=1 Tax=Pacificimonas pallii TaxID=2827236 RepID=A0ABS6SAC5_9SPHN|nr:patatin-like protein [Pacificimonas pallii]MBV7255231.1 patatin-like protein [Pacificimonas pallii]